MMSQPGDEFQKSSENAQSEHTRISEGQANSGVPVPAGLEAVEPGLMPYNDGDKQACQPEKQTLFAENFHKGAAEPLIHSEQPPVALDDAPKKRRVCGLKAGLFWTTLAVIILVVLGIALGAGLGVGLSKGDTNPESSDENNSTQDSMPPATPSPGDSLFEIGGSIDPSYYSSRNVWNGSGLAHLWQTLPSGFQSQPPDNRSLVLYYQHPTGDIRWMRRASDDKWWLSLNSDFPTVTTSAKNSTPISAVSTSQSGTDVWHVFCKR